MLKLFEVEVEFCGGDTVMVLAEDKYAAKDIGIEAVEDNDVDYSASARLVVCPEEIPHGWSDEVPWGEHDSGLTCQEWLADGLLQRAKPVPDPRQLMFGEVPLHKYDAPPYRKILQYNRLLDEIGTDVTQATEEQRDQLFSLMQDRDVLAHLDTPKQLPSVLREAQQLREKS